MAGLFFCLVLDIRQAWLPGGGFGFNNKGARPQLNSSATAILTQTYLFSFSIFCFTILP